MPRGCVALRPAPGVRRTTSIDVVWPKGRHGGMSLLGHGRDILSLNAGKAPAILAEDQLSLDLGADRVVHAVRSRPPRPVLNRLLGPGRDVRSALRNLLEADSVEHSLLYQLVDDMPGVMVVADWAWSRWPTLVDTEEATHRKTKLSRMEGVCIGFRPGSSALRTEGEYQDDMAVSVPLPQHPQDPHGWHSMIEMTEVSLRRARCIDVWLESGLLQIEAYFQDSGTSPGGVRVAVHEYTIRAKASLDTGDLLDLRATPHVLPFAECQGAIERIHELQGRPIKDLRTSVPELLGRVRGCTHLNDALRALADVPLLAGRLLRATGLKD